MTEPVDPAGQDPDAWVVDVLRLYEPMPAPVWARLDAALREQSTARLDLGQTATVANITDLGSQRRRSALLSGLVAAALVLVAAGLIIPGLRNSGGNPGAVVAEEAPVSLVATAPVALATGPARQVMSSGLDYSAETMPTDIQQAVDTIGASNARLMSDVQPDTSMTEGLDGFTSSLPLLRSCLTWLTGSDRIQALLVDRARFEGVPAAIVVVPAGAQVPILASLEVWVVTLDCARDDASILSHEMVSIIAN